MVQQLYSDLEELRKEIRRLRGELKRVVSGNVIIAPGNPGTATVPTAVDGALIRGNATPGWERLAASVPGSGLRNVVGLDNGDVRPSYKALLDTTAPTTLDYDDVAAAGTSLIASRRDHRHGMPAEGGGSITGLIVYVPFGSEAVEGESFSP